MFVCSFCRDIAVVSEGSCRACVHPSWAWTRSTTTMASCQGPCAAALCLTMLQGLCSASHWTMKRLQLWPLLTGRPWSRSWRWPGSRTTKLLPTGWRYALFLLKICLTCTAHASHFDFVPTFSRRDVSSIRRSSDFLGLLTQHHFAKAAENPTKLCTRYILCTVLLDSQLLWPNGVASSTQLPIEKPLPKHHNYSGLLLLCCMRCHCVQHTLPYSEESLRRLF